MKVKNAKKCKTVLTDRESRLLHIILGQFTPDDMTKMFAENDEAFAALGINSGLELDQVTDAMYRPLSQAFGSGGKFA